MAGKHTIIPHLWFDRNAEDAVNFYIKIDVRRLDDAFAGKD
jgi:predicted 3-demethylubiquinone-9 3-methyltransferase (glyoxalase superfamily)